MREEDDGTWTVYLILTELPAVVGGIPQIRLDVDDAGYVVDLLNQIAEDDDAAEQ
jgi:hypothetical protein